MADLVVGMAKSVVEGTLGKAQAAIDQEEKLRQSAQRNLVFIAGEFQMLQSFLQVADGARLQNVVVKTWVRQIRDLAYDVEDCIEFVVHLDRRNRWWLRLLQPVRWVMPCLAPLQLDQAVDELDQLKARVEDVSMRNARYSLISDSGSRAEQQPVSDGATAFNRLIKATWQGSLTQLLVDTECGDDVGVISVWGTGRGDLGTTSILWSAYTDPRKNFACRAWVKLGHPFNQDEFVRSLMAQFYSDTCHQEEEKEILPVEKMKAGQGHLLDEFVRYVKEKRFLIVLEDLSSMEQWNTIKTFFPKRNNGSCIVVSTQQLEVASLSVGHPYHVRQLSTEHSVYAFFKMASQLKGENNPPDSTGKKVAAEKWIKDHGLVGRESAVKDLNIICRKEAFGVYQVMSVWGIAGIGKSVLVKHLFCQKILRSRVYNKYAWVELSHPFDLWDFCRSLLLSFESQYLQASNAKHGTMGSENPVAECREMLRFSCFIVIDGLKSTEEWDMIKNELAYDQDNRTVIVVITTDERIATHCRGSKGPLTYHVKPMEPEAALQLFNEKSMMETSEFSVLEELLSKCGGIPRVIVEIAGSIARRRVRIKDRERYINDNFVQELETNREFALLSGLFYWVQSYFRNCPDSLKPCIFYLSIFTPKQLIRRRRLVRRWIAEGYSKDNHDKTAEENGEEQFSNLLNQSIVQKGSSVVLGATRMVSCEVNGFFREYIVSKRMEENLVFELDGSCAPTTQRTGRHLVISESWVRDEIVYNSIDFSKLRSLTVSGKWEKFFISAGMKLLRVLDLEDALHVEYNDLKKIMKWFPRLKFLSLRGHNEICQLPSSIGDLRQLQSLDLRGTSIVTLPASVTKLEKLQYIRVGTTTPTEAPRLPVSRLSHYSRGRCHLVGIQMPQGIRKLTPLHTLGVVNVRSSGIKIFLEDLKKLTQLHKLGVSGIDKSNRKKFWSAISVHTSLESLSVQFDKNSSQGCFDGIALPQNSLRSLKLYGLGEGQLSKLITPAVSGLSKIAKMNLEMAMLKKQDVNSLGELSELCILRLCFQELEGDELKFCTTAHCYEVNSYLKLKVLDITCSSVSGLPIVFGLKTMKELEQLKVEWSSESSDQFSGLKNLPELKEVLLNGSHIETSDCSVLAEDFSTNLGLGWI
ncbi:hypothetical protein QYE76_000281 [Lolium multiflorum]|uniref:Disease resistance protein RPM1 n=1 Tax=Lolium multiflorum TaxID=4521 RepID=A0AAD8VYL5_LOLMU|nr:hypothetical protein QYE76_000281 [Lolium multiflorum]